MIIISWNVRDFKEWDKRAFIKREIVKHNLTIVIFQEPKTISFNCFLIQSIWSSCNIGWTSLEANKSVGGILIMWNDLAFSISDITKG